MPHTQLPSWWTHNRQGHGSSFRNPTQPIDEKYSVTHHHKFTTVMSQHKILQRPLAENVKSNCKSSMLSSEPRTAQRMSSIQSIASAVFGNSIERASAMVRLTAEKSLSDWAELAEIQRMRLATLADSGNCHSSFKIPAESCVRPGLTSPYIYVAS